MRPLLWTGILLITATAAAADEPIRVICFGAHPDDCELKAGGVAAMWAAKGHKVKFVSVTNGDIGHWKEAGGPLVRRATGPPSPLAADRRSADPAAGRSRASDSACTRT